VSKLGANNVDSYGIEPIDACSVNMAALVAATWVTANVVYTYSSNGARYASLGDPYDDTILDSITYCRKRCYSDPNTYIYNDVFNDQFMNIIDGNNNGRLCEVPNNYVPGPPEIPGGVPRNYRFEGEASCGIFPYLRYSNSGEDAPDQTYGVRTAHVSTEPASKTQYTWGEQTRVGHVGRNRTISYDSYNMGDGYQLYPSDYINFYSVAGDKLTFGHTLESDIALTFRMKFPDSGMVSTPSRRLQAPEPPTPGPPTPEPPRKSNETCITGPICGNTIGGESLQILTVYVNASGTIGYTRVASNIGGACTYEGVGYNEIIAVNGTYAIYIPMFCHVETTVVTIASDPLSTCAPFSITCGVNVPTNHNSPGESGNDVPVYPDSDCSCLFLNLPYICGCWSWAWESVLMIIAVIVIALLIACCASNCTCSFCCRGAPTSRIYVDDRRKEN